jgi:hypothetical protein
MTNDEIVCMLPQIQRAAKRLARNGCDPDDLVQQAVYKLMTRDRVAIYPIVTAMSTMKDYCTTHGYKPNCSTMERQPHSSIFNSTKEYKNYEPDWEGIPFTAEELDIVILFTEEGWTKEQIAELYDTNTMWIVRVLRRAAKKAAVAWRIINKDTGEIE